MTLQPLLDILKPAYEPCQHFEGKCAGACKWEPARGIVPCGFGGATGSTNDVKLVIVTAEPGDPPDNANYIGSPTDMLHNSLRIFDEAMNCGLNRKGRPTPFHQNLKRILDLYFPGQSLAEQLKQTWMTNAVLCPAPISGGPHMKLVEKTCASTYLARQLALFPKAFVLALGGKARNRMQATGLAFHAVGCHPSARGSDAKKIASWKASAWRFPNEQSNGIARPKTVRPPHGTSHQMKETAKSSVPQEATDLHAASGALPPEVPEFFRRVDCHQDYACRVGRMQLMINFRGQKVGGFNRRQSHWYFSKVFVRQHGSIDLMEKHGFAHVVHNERHDYWTTKEPGALDSFEEAMVAMTGVPLLVPS
jgi:hypothetical protein